MGCIKTISASQFPTQGAHLGCRVQVCFHYDTAHLLNGTCVRDDREPPWRTIFRLDDGRYILATECQYTLV